MLFYNCSVFIYSTVAGHKCEINLIVIVKTSQNLLYSVNCTDVCWYMLIQCYW